MNEERRHLTPEQRAAWKKEWDEVWDRHFKEDCKLSRETAEKLVKVVPYGNGFTVEMCSVWINADATNPKRPEPRMHHVLGRFPDEESANKCADKVRSILRFPIEQAVKKGKKEMQEKAAKVADEYAGDDLAKAIRAIPIYPVLAAAKAAGKAQPLE